MGDKISKGSEKVIW